MARGDPDEGRRRREKADVEWLSKQPQFKRFLWRAIQLSGLFSRTTDGSRDLSADYFVGRRDLGLALLEMVELGQPAARGEGPPVLTLIQTLLEEANPQPSEKDDARNDTRFDRNAELGLDDDDEDASDRA